MSAGTPSGSDPVTLPGAPLRYACATAAPTPPRLLPDRATTIRYTEYCPSIGKSVAVGGWRPPPYRAYRAGTSLRSHRSRAVPYPRGSVPTRYTSPAGGVVLYG